MDAYIQKYRDYQYDTLIIDEIKALILPSYKNAGSHVNHDIEICNELYVIRSSGGQMLAFFMVGYHQIDAIDCCYLGLSTCRQEYKNSGYVKELYLTFARDCIRKELYLNKRITCYWTTATPIVYHWFTKYFSDVQPDRTGHCDETGRTLLFAIASEKYKHAGFDERIPFVLRNAAIGINYSDQEHHRLEDAIVSLNLSVFSDHHLDERNGDRFLMLGYAPSHDRLIELTKNNFELLSVSGP